MPKYYGLIFGSGKASTKTGLSPTMTIFSSQGLTSMIGPTITELPTSSGMYQFIYSPSLPIYFEADGGSTLGDSDRYIYGILDPIQATDEKIGTINDSFGTTASDPTTLMGFAKRNQEFEEGNANFNKGSAIWTIYSRGSSTLLRSKTLTNTITNADKS